MPYIGKPQSADPITVNTSNIDDGTIQAVDISSSFREHISGSFQGGGSNKISGSLTSTGSFGKVEVGSGKITTTGNMVLDADGAQIRLEDGGTEFGRISRVSSDLVIKSISNNNDILFKGVDGSSTITALQLDMSEAGNAIFNNDVTIAGTLTAQEIHTEFTSASILFTSGSTIFGDTIDDTHKMTGSLFVSGNIHLPDDAKINLGSSDDGNIKHSGTNLQIQETTGNIQLINYANDKDISLSTDDGSGGTTAYITLDGSTTKVEVAKDTNFAGNISGSATSTASLAMISLADKIEHIGDTNNTIEFGTDEIKLRTGGGSRLIARDSNVELYNDLVVAGAATFNEDSGDKDFRVESNGNANMLFVDGGNNRVGIGTNTPDYIFDVESSSTTFMRLLSTNTNGVAGLYMENDTVKWYIDTHGGVNDSFLIGEENVLGGTALSITTANSVGIGTQTPVSGGLHIHTDASTEGIYLKSEGNTRNNLVFDSNISSAADNIAFIDANWNGTNVARISMFTGTDTSNKDDGRIGFATAASGTVAERMRIESDGRVAIKATSFPQDFGNDRGHLLISSVDDGGANNYAVLQIQGYSIANDVATGGIYFYDHDNNTAVIQVQRDDSTSKGNMVFYTNGGSGVAERMRIDVDGNLMIGRTNNNFNNDGSLINPGSFYYLERSSGTANSLLYLHRRNGDGKLINFYESNTEEGYISVTGATVSLTGFQGAHQATGIPIDTPTGTVVSTIDEEFKYRHANVKISDTVGDKRVYGVVENFRPEQTDDTGNTQPASFSNFQTSQSLGL